MTSPPLRIAVAGLGYWGPNLARNFAAIEACELAYCCDESEAARGWDAMALLQELVPHVREITERWRRVNKAKAPRTGENERRCKLWTCITTRPIRLGKEAS